jgi:hypothetical protein
MGDSTFFICEEGRHGLLENVHKHTHGGSDAYNEGNREHGIPLCLLNPVFTDTEPNFSTHCELDSHGNHVTESNDIDDSYLSGEFSDLHPSSEDSQNFKGPPLKTLEHCCAYSLAYEGSPASESLLI